MKKPITVNRQALDGMLPGIPEDFEGRMRCLITTLPQQRKDIVMKKKLSLGLVLALILALLAIGALAAALLGGREFTDKILAPKAQETSSDMFTPDEIDEILAIAAENGIELPDYLLTSIKSSEEGYYKEELMRAFVKTELGFYPSCWSIEDQAWYNRLLVACKLEEYQYSVVPEGDEIKQEQALDIAIAAIREQFEADFDPEGGVDYRRHMGYKLYNQNEYTKDRLWTIEYEPLDLYHNGYAAGVLSDGTLLEVLATSYGVDSPEADIYSIESRFSYLYSDQYGSKAAWSEQNWVDFHAALTRCLANSPDAVTNENFKAILRQTYLTPESAAITRQQAIDLAKQAAGAYGPFDESATALYLTGADGPAWKVTLRENRAAKAYAQVDDNTGAVVVIQPDNYDYWVRPFVLEENMPETPLPDPRKAIAAYPTTRPDGKVGLWGSDIAPDYFWAELDKLGYTSETGGDLYEKWCMDYGYDQLFWPLNLRAIMYVLHELSPGATGSPVIHGLPDENDMTQDDAVKLAWDTFLASPEAADMGEDKARALKPSIQFFFHAPDAGDHTWYIAFVDVSGAAAQTLYGVIIDAKTGEVLGTGLYSPYGNG